MEWLRLGVLFKRTRYPKADDVLGIPRATTETRDALLESLLAEFHAFREEMRWLREEAAQYQGFALVIAAALGPLLGFELAKEPLWVIPTLTVIPLPFTILGFLFFRQHLEVYIVADYVREVIRPKIRKLCATSDLPDLWTFEEYKYESFGRLSKFRWLDWVLSPRLAQAMRTTLFLGPAGATTLFDVILVIHVGFRKMEHNYGGTEVIMIFVGFGISILFTLMLALLLWVRGNFAEFVMGDGQPTRRRARRAAEVEAPLA